MEMIVANDMVIFVKNYFYEKKILKQAVAISSIKLVSTTIWSTYVCRKMTGVTHSLCHVTQAFLIAVLCLYDSHISPASQT